MDVPAYVNAVVSICDNVQVLIESAAKSAGMSPTLVSLYGQAEIVRSLSQDLLAELEGGKS